MVTQRRSIYRRARCCFPNEEHLVVKLLILVLELEFFFAGNSAMDFKFIRLIILSMRI